MNSVTSTLMKKIVKKSTNVLKESIQLPKVKSLNDRISFRMKLDRSLNDTRHSTTNTVHEAELVFPEYYTTKSKKNTFFSESNESDFDSPVAYRKDVINMNANM